MPKVCSRKFCKRLTDGKFKCCQKCRDESKKRMRKRKEKASKATAKDGYKYCKHCLKEFPLAHFHSSHSRRKKLTARCVRCRAINSKSIRSKSTITGKCKQVFLDWKIDKSCELCGYNGPCIEADHIGEKKHDCGDTNWWTWNGGPEALKKELSSSIVRPLCSFCHRIKTKNERGTDKSASRIKRRSHVNAIKLKIGACELCKRKLEKEEECCAFDFDHIRPESKHHSISKMVANFSLKRFYKCISEEISKCRLLCANCHIDHTRKQNRENFNELQKIIS